MKFCLFRFSIAKVFFLSYFAATHAVVGQVIPDGTVSTQVNPLGNEYRITEGTQVGGNLFHSFTEFSLPAGTIANFDNPTNVLNIINRVTGKTASNIDGLIRTRGTTNLILINPNGITFGPNAQLNVGGSFLATTANSLKFADGSEFSTIDPSTPSLLTVSVPVGLQFGQNPGAIVHRSRSTIPTSTGGTRTVGLQILPGKTFALVGGNIEIERGFITSTQGRVELGSVADDSFVSLTSIQQGWDVSYEGVNRFQDIRFSQDATINSLNSRGIQIQGQHVALLDQSFIGVAAIGAETPGDIIITASESVEIINVSNPSGIAALVSTAQPTANGRGGNIRIDTKRLLLRDGGTITTDTTGKAQAGQISIDASESVEVIGSEIRTPSFLSTSTGNFRNFNDEGNGGQLIINTGQLEVRDGGQIAATTISKGQGGTIIINALEVRVAGKEAAARQFPSQIVTSSGLESLQFAGQGKGGNLSINADRLIVEDGGQISAGSFQGGEAGNLNITANSILLDHQGQLIARSTSTGGGNITLKATDFLELRNNSLITATSGTPESGGGSGGNINIDTQFIFAVPSEDSNIEANAFAGNGGSVNIRASGIYGIQFREQPTRLSDITVSSEFGQSGVFILNRPDVDPQSGLVNLPTEVVDTGNLVVQSCGASGELAKSEFTITGRGGLPVDYNQSVELDRGLPDFGTYSISANVPSMEAVPDSSQQPQTTDVKPIVEAQGWAIDEQGKVILTAQASQVTSHHRETAAKCRS